MHRVHHSHLREIGAAIFEAAGVPSEQAEIAINHLVEANLVGHDSHGVLHIPGYVRGLREGRIRPVGKEKIVRETPVSAVIDASGSFGIVLAYSTMVMAIEKAKSNALGAVAVHRSSHIGRLGAYPPLATVENCIGILLLNGGGRFVAPFGGVDRRLPPNPIAISVPTLDGPPMMLDITTSMVAGGKVLVHNSKNEPVPEKWLINERGEPETDPATFLAAQSAMLPFGDIVGHKGYGLAMMIDAIAGGLSWAGCSSEEPTRGGSGYLALAINIESFIDIDEYKREIQKLIDWVKSSRTMPGVERIYLPGEIEDERRRQRETEGIDIPEKVWKSIKETASELGVAV